MPSVAGAGRQGMADSAPPVVRRIVDAMESVAPQTSIAPPALTATAAPSPAASEAPAPPTPTRPRNLTLDWLRVLGICAVLVIHLGEVFNPWDEWHVSNPVRSRLAGEVVVFFAPWIMPMMFLVAGWSSCYALERRPNRRFVRERFVRLGIPLVLGVLLLVPPQVYLERRLRGQFTGSLVAFYPHFFEGIYPQGNFSWHHLWFLGHLLVYSLVALPLFRYWRSERGRLQLRRIATWCAGPFGLLWLAAPLVLERHVLWWLLPARAALTVDWANHAILFVAFVYGYMLAAEPAFLTDLDQQWKSAARFAIAMSAALWAMAWRGLLPNGIPEPYSTGYLAFWSIYGVGAWAWVVFGTAFSIFAAAALLLSGVGLYAVMSQATARRTREIGIRIALGATRLHVLRTVVQRGVIQIATGLAGGLVLAWFATGAMRALLFGVTPHDPLVLGLSIAILVTVGFTACVLPARRAAALSPVRALASDD